MNVPRHTSTEEAVRIPPTGERDLAYAAWLFQRAALVAQQAIRAAVAAGVEVPGWVGPAAWLYEYEAWSLARTAAGEAGLAGTDGAASGPSGSAAGSRRPQRYR